MSDSLPVKPSDNCILLAMVDTTIDYGVMVLLLLVLLLLFAIEREKLVIGGGTK